MASGFWPKAKASPEKNRLLLGLRTERSSAGIVLPCPNVCTAPFPVAGDDTSCWPRHEVRTAKIALAAEATLDSNVKRENSSTVRLRNDQVHFSVPAVVPAGAPAKICPAA